MTFEEYLNIYSELYQAYYRKEITKEDLSDELAFLDDEPIENDWYDE